MLTCLMITTTVRDRLPLLHNTIMSIEAANYGQIGQRVLAVDVVDPHPYCPEDFAEYVRRGWTVVHGPCSGRRGMANNMLRGLREVTGDLLFYCEDDVVIHKIPTPDTLAVLFSHSWPSCGFIVYNTHACAPWVKSGTEPKLAYINNLSNYRWFSNDLFLQKGEAIRDEYWICFPAAIFATEKFRACLDYACTHCLGMGMEPAMTRAWFELHFDAHPALVYVKPETVQRLPLSFQDFYDAAQMQFWNNDVNLRHKSVNDRQNTLF